MEFKLTNKNNLLPRFQASAEAGLCNRMLAAFRESGAVILEDFVPLAECKALKTRALQLVEEFDPNDVRSVFSTTKQTQLDDQYFIESGDKIRYFLEDGAFDENGRLLQNKEDSLNKIGHAMHDLDPVFDAFSRTPALEQVVRCLGVKDPALLQSMYIFKPPRIGGEVICHQDSTYLYTEPESCLGFWFAIEDATVENGCMQFIPGGHRGPLKQRNRRISQTLTRTEVLDDTPWPMNEVVPAEAKAGTLVIFHGRAPHYSGPNLSVRSRHAYTLHVIDRNSHYPADNWLQRGANLPLRGFSQD